MLLDLIVLGANSALPLVDRFSSSFVLRTSHRSILVDAGEGCQMKLGQFKVKRSRISHIFISHLHGDHVFGLPGLITSFNLNNRTQKLTVFGPEGLKKFVNVILEVSQVNLKFELEVNEIDSVGQIHLATLDDLDVSAFPLKHRIPTYGFLFKESGTSINIKPESVKNYNLSIDEIKMAKKGLDIKRETELIPNSEITYTKHGPRSFAYCSDTGYDPSLAEICHGVSLMYHEATYLHELQAQAAMRLHSTSREAAEIAKKSNAKKLLIGHYSSRYTDLNPLLEEAREVFPDTELAVEGKIILII